MRLIKLAVFLLVAAFVAVYLGDWALYRLRGAPQSAVTVNRTLAVPLKGNKQEFDLLGSVSQPCSQSLFAQSGLTPCWQLRRHPNQVTTM